MELLKLGLYKKRDHVKDNFRRSEFVVFFSMVQFKMRRMTVSWHLGQNCLYFL